MDVVFPFALLCFTSLFTITNPLSMMPVFLTMTHSMDEKARRAIVKKASIIACITLILFVLAGQFLFKFFGISTDGFRIVGGFIIFRIGYDMLQAKYTSMVAMIGRAPLMPAQRALARSNIIPRTCSSK